jgi:predicted DCC family thiol-disulfide oxidoreductase YuxK
VTALFYSLLLKKVDVEQKVVLEDLNATDFDARFPYIDKNRAMEILHAQMITGEIIYGLNVTYAAWKTVGKHKWLIILRLPVIRIFSDLGYTFFTKYRQPISCFLMPNACKKNKCSIQDQNKIEK